MNSLAVILLDIIPVSLVLAQRDHLASVSYFPSIENFYIYVKQQPSASRHEPPLNADARKAICRIITSGDYFDSPNTARVDHMEDVYRKLKRRYRPIFRRIYSRNKAVTDPEHPEPRCFSFFGKYEYVNEYTPRKITFKNEHFSNVTADEDVFVCVTVNTVSKAIDAWCVSREYNIDIAARFIFRCSDKNSMELVALAEEASRVEMNTLTEIERHYIQVRKENVPVQSSRTDPVCVQVENKSQHSRVCVAVFASSLFRRSVKFVLPSEPDEHHCRRRPINFRNEHSDLEPSNNYWEWMSLCRGRDKRYRDDVHYFISRAYSRNRVFVYEYHTRGPQRGKIFLISLNGNIISILDGGNSIQQPSAYTDERNI